MKLEYQDIRAELDNAANEAKRVFLANKDYGSPVASISYDSGRCAGLLEAIEILDKLYDRS